MAQLPVVLVLTTRMLRLGRLVDQGQIQLGCRV